MMKNIFITLLLLTLTILAYGESRKFVINGKISELTSGNMVLITRTLNGMDTLAKAPILNGAFHMEGSLEQPVVALIAVEKYQGGFIFLLDTDAPYAMELYQNKKSTITGGELQQTLLAYQAIVEEANTGMKGIKEQIGQAVQQRRFKTKQELERQLERHQADAQSKLQAIIDKNKNNLFAAYIQTSGLDQVVELSVLKDKYALLAEGARTTMPGKVLAARIAELESVAVEAVAPDFLLMTPEGKEVSMYGVKGKLKIIDFWASWCGPCRMENPNMVKLYQDFKDKGLEVISVSLDNRKEKWVEAIQKDGMSWIHVSSLKGWNDEVVKKYGVDAVPAIFVLDENNKILAKQLRGEKLHSFVEERLK